MRLQKSTQFITALHGLATDVLHGDPKGATYEEIFEAVENRFWTSRLSQSAENENTVR
jgi:hypothetical protein